MRLGNRIGRKVGHKSQFQQKSVIDVVGYNFEAFSTFLPRILLFTENGFLIIKKVK